MCDKTVMDVEGKDSSKTWNLKKRLTNRYPQICFLQPNRKDESQFVLVDNLSIDKLIIDYTLLHESVVGLDTDDQQDSLSNNEQLTRKSTPLIDGNKESSFLLSNLRDWFATALDTKLVISNVSTTTFPLPKGNNTLV